MSEKHLFKHKCKLPPEKKYEPVINWYIDSGLFIFTRRYLKGLTMVSTDHPKALRYVRSIPAQRKEEKRHLFHHYYIIHPLSKVAQYNQIMMFILLTIFYLLMPFIYMKSPSNSLSLTFAILHVIYICQMILICFTGYLHTNTIELRPKRILFKYLKTYMIWDLLSTVPFFYEELHVIFKWSDIRFQKIICSFECFKIARYYMWTVTYAQIMDYFSVPKNVSIIVGFILRSFIGLFLLFTIRHMLRTFDAATMDYVEEKAGEFLEYYEFIVQVLGISYGLAISHTTRNSLLCVIFLLLGFGMLLRILCLFWQHLNKYFSTALIETVSYSQYEAYATYIGLTPELQEKIHMYLDFKYQNEYYKEHIIARIIGPDLLKEVARTVSNGRFNKVKLFNTLPKHLKTELEERLKFDTFLPGDIILKAGARVDRMYIIIYGTVIVSGEEGEHVCCLEDGASFGELFLILSKRMTTTIIAATPCEMLVLKRSDYDQVLNAHRETKFHLQSSALGKLNIRGADIVEGPVCQLFDPGRGHGHGHGSSATTKDDEDANKDSSLEFAATIKSSGKSIQYSGSIKSLRKSMSSKSQLNLQ